MKKRIIDMTFGESPMWFMYFQYSIVVTFLLALSLKSPFFVFLFLFEVFVWLGILTFTPEIEIKK